MGWCSGTYIFDSVVSALLSEDKKDIESIISEFIDELENMDWDCQEDSEYFNHPLVEKIFRKKHPNWFE